MKRILTLVLVIALAVSGWYFYNLYTAKIKSLSETTADVRLNATDLIAAYQKDSSAAGRLYLGKILEVNGNIKSIEAESSTLVLGEENSMWSIRCSMDSAYAQQIVTLNPANKVTVKGNCTGFNADELGLGSDIVLNRCVLVQ